MHSISVRAPSARPLTPRALRAGLLPNSLTTLEVWGEHAHYDLGDDPLAAKNLRASEPESYLKGLRRLRAFLENPTSAPGALASELSEEEQERLRSLGY